MRAVYGKRNHFMTLDEVVEDLNKLQKYMKEKFNYDIKLSRPPHYIDKISDGSTSYDAYRIMGYNYMAASFDGAGWQPLETYEKEVNAMIEPLKVALEKDENSLNGKIIFQKDGCNMNLRTPVADALEEQLKLLKEYGYKVITVSDLLKMSPFEDLKNTCSEMKYIIVDFICYESYREYPIEGGPTCFLKTIFSRKLLKYASRLLEEIGFNGIAMLDFKWTVDNPYFLEINPRVWESANVVDVSKSTFFESYVKAAKNEKEPVNIEKCEATYKINTKCASRHKALHVLCHI
jgi:hypothetical protein